MNDIFKGHYRLVAAQAARRGFIPRTSACHKIKFSFQLPSRACAKARHTLNRSTEAGVQIYHIRTRLYPLSGAYDFRLGSSPCPSHFHQCLREAICVINCSYALMPRIVLLEYLAGMVRGEVLVATEWEWLAEQ